MIWKDENDKMLDILDELDKEEITFPALCPVCEKKESHLYMHKENAENIGGLWVWCSHCKYYIHASYKIPQWWNNSLEINETKLSPNPQYLEENKQLVDTWVEQLFESKKRK